MIKFFKRKFYEAIGEIVNQAYMSDKDRQKQAEALQKQMKRR